MTAIHDAVALANWIATLHKPKLEDIEAIFAEYQAERLPVAREAVATTKFFKSMGGKVRQQNKSKVLRTRCCCTISIDKVLFWSIVCCRFLEQVSLPPYASMAA